MKISYSILTHNEDDSLQKLLEFLVSHKDDEDEMKKHRYEAVQAEEEVNESEVEEQFAAEQTEEVVAEVEDKTINFERITSEKMNLINKHFPSLY